MSQSAARKLLLLLSAAAALWLGGNYLLPLMMPFLLGFALALAAEPAVGLLEKRLRLKRGLGALVGVSLTLVLLLSLAVLLFSVLFKELGRITTILPDLESTALQGVTALEDWLLSLAARAPDSLQPLLTKSVLGLFDNGTAFYDRAISQLPGLATALLSHIPDSALGLGTGLLSAYLFSSRMSAITAWCRSHVSAGWANKWLPALKSLRAALAGWLRAQLKLMLLTWAIVGGGLWILRIPYALFWALLIALIDAVPLLGTGLVLLPWSLVRLSLGDLYQAVGLLVIMAAAMLTRSMLEPRLLGRQLGLDPLVTLAAMYLGYQLFGFLGMLLAPLAAVTVQQLTKTAADGP